MNDGAARLFEDMSIELGKIGIWRHSSGLTPEVLAEVEALGYGAIWIGGSPAGDLNIIEGILDATDHIAVATGILNIWKDDAATVGPSYHRVTAKHPGRFLLGLGIGHPEATQEYQKPYAKLVSYLDELDELKVPTEGRALAALGPKVLRLSAERSAGAHPYLVTPEHTREARQILESAFAPDSVGRIDYEMVRFDRWDPDFSTTAVHALDAALFLARSPFRSAEVRFQPQVMGQLETANILVHAVCACGTRVLVNIQPVAGTNAESVRIRAVGQSLSAWIPVSPTSQGDGSVEHWRSDALISSFSDREAGKVDRMGVLGETGAFLEAVLNGGPFSPQLEDCQQQVALMEAIRMRRDGQVDFAMP